MLQILSNVGQIHHIIKQSANSCQYDDILKRQREIYSNIVVHFSTVGSLFLPQVQNNPQKSIQGSEEAIFRMMYLTSWKESMVINGPVCFTFWL